MDNIRTYGRRPYQLALIHGGPGDIGSLGFLASQLSTAINVVEPLQSKYSIDELVEELHQQLADYSTKSISLLGHSWGALLAIIYATQYPEEVDQLILVGTPPLDKKYAPLVAENRNKHFSNQEYQEFQNLLTSDSKEAISKLKQLMLKSDYVHPIHQKEVDAYLLKVDLAMGEKVWGEAEQLRNSGYFKEVIKQLSVPVCFIHGEDDPHPFKGVIQPMNEAHPTYTSHIFPRCGHYPFYEKEWHDSFIEIVTNLVSSTDS